MREANVDIVRRLFETDAARGGDSRLFRAPDRLREYFRGLTQADARIETSAFRFEDRGDAVLVPGRIRVRAGGALSDNPVYWVLRLHNGEVLRSASYLTAEEAEAEVG